MQSSDGLRVFVYGTLKPGEANYQRYCAGKLVNAQRAMVLGKLFALPAGYPAMTLGDTPVQGYLLSFADLENLTNRGSPHPQLVSSVGIGSGG